MVRTYNDYLLHYGVKGMKWGIRHDPVRSPRSNKKTSPSFKLSKGTKKALMVTGIAAGTAAALVLMKYGKVHADDIMRAGTTIQTVHNHPEIILRGEKFYTTNKFWDKVKYRASFGKNNEGIKKKITGEVASNIKIAGGDTGRKTMVSLMNNDKEFSKFIKDNYGNVDFNDKKKAARVYKKFNTFGLIGKADYNSKEHVDKFINALKKQGYDGVADMNDRHGWKTSANILFDNSKIKNIKVTQMTEQDLRKAKGILAGGEIFGTFVNEENAVTIAATTAPIAGLGVYGDYTSYKRKKNKKTKKKAG